MAGVIVFLYFAFALIVVGFIWLAVTPQVYALKNDEDRWAVVSQYAPDFLTTRDLLYTIFQFWPFIGALFCGVIYIVVSSSQGR